MWIEVVCGLVLYKVLRLFFSGDDELLDVESSDFNAIFSVAARVEKVYGGKAFVGLRIPDGDAPVNIDIVLLTPQEALVISVKNMSGFVSVNSDATWLCISDHKPNEELLPDPVAEAKHQASVLEAYLEQRGVSVAQGFFTYKVITSNPKFRTLNPDAFPPQVIQYDQWLNLKPHSKGLLSGWFQGTFRSNNKQLQDSVHQHLHFALNTAPIWDRLELKSSKYILGEFLEFKGKHEDIQALQYIKRSKVGRMIVQKIVQKTSMLGFAPTRLQVLYSFRDYRNEGASGSAWKEVTVRSSTEVLFQPLNSKKSRKFKLSSITSLTLSA